MYQEVLNTFTKPLSQIPLAWDKKQITVFAQAEQWHALPALTTGFIRGFFDQYSMEAHWSPYASSENRRLKKRPCEPKPGRRCPVHERGDDDLATDYTYHFIVLEQDMVDHDTCQYDLERSARLLLITVDKWPTALPLPSMVALSPSGGPRWIFVLKTPIQHIEDYEAIHKGIVQALAAAIDPHTKGLGAFDQKTPDGFREWRLPWVTTEKRGQTFDRPIYLIHTNEIDPLILPYIEAEQELPNPNAALLAQIRAKVAASSSSMTPEIRASRYIRQIESVQGQEGDSACFEVACALVRGFALSQETARALIHDWNLTNANPPWAEVDLELKVRDAGKMDSIPLGCLLAKERVQS